MFGLVRSRCQLDKYVTGETCNAVAATVQCNSKSDRFGTFAGRLGIAADSTLVYFKGGAAWTHDIHDLVLCCGVVEATVSGGKWGWTAGTGLEYALTRNWSAKLEYDFMDFGTSRFVFDVPTVGGTGTAPPKSEQRVHALKFRLELQVRLERSRRRQLLSVRQLLRGRADD